MQPIEQALQDMANFNFHGEEERIVNQPWTYKFALRKQAVVRLFVPFVILVSDGAAAQTGTTSETDNNVAASAQCTPCTAGQCVYSVINLLPGADWGAYLNQKGQVATYGAARNGFFDGDRLYELGSLGGGYTFVQGLNNRGVVVGESNDDSGPYGGQVLAFSWSVAGGMRALPGWSVSSAHAINDKNQIVGFTSAPGIISHRAVRWNPDGSTTNLGPPPQSSSEAWTINNHGEAGGYTDLIDGSIHAMKWTASGSPIDLGTMSGTNTAFTYFVNQRGEAAGLAGNDDGNYVFFWNSRDGMVATGAHENQGSGQVVALNERSEVAGNTRLPAGRVPFLWSRSRGLVLLPGSTPEFTNVWSMNNRTQLVGYKGSGSGDMRAVLWDGPTNPVDLNTRLHRPPAGLVLISAVAINDAGDIAAYSNAGMVLLRPGTRGTDAPVLGPIMGLPDTVNTGDDVQLTLGFVDNSRTQTHTVAVNWEDGCNSPHPLLQETGGVGVVKFQHHFCASGAYGVSVRVTDSAGRTTEVASQINVNYPATATLNGKGTLAPMRSGGGSSALPLHFTLWAPLGNDSATTSSGFKAGTPLVRLSGPIQLLGEQFGTPTRSGQQVRLEGTGRLNGRPGYRFLIEAVDGSRQQPATGDRLRVRVAHTDGNGIEVVDYDNLAPTTTAAAGVAGKADRTRVANGRVKLSN